MLGASFSVFLLMCFRSITGPRLFLWILMTELWKSPNKATVVLLRRILSLLSHMILCIMWQSACLVTTGVSSAACTETSAAITKDDFGNNKGAIISNVNSFGDTWKFRIPGVVCKNGCRGNNCPDCKALFSKFAYCGVMTATTLSNLMTACLMCVLPTGTEACCVTA